MKLLLARLLYRFLGCRHVTVWGWDAEYALLGLEDDVVWLHVGRHWVTAWSYWWDHVDERTVHYVTVHRFPTHAVRSINDRGWER